MDAPVAEGILPDLRSAIFLRMVRTSEELGAGVSGESIARSWFSARASSWSTFTPAAVTMVATASSHYELIASAPRTAALRGRLKAAPYAGAEADAELPDEPAVGGDEMAVEGAPTAGRAARPTMAELERTVQCSAAQLRAEQRQMVAMVGPTIQKVATAEARGRAELY